VCIRLINNSRLVYSIVLYCECAAWASTSTHVCQKFQVRGKFRTGGDRFFTYAKSVQNCRNDLECVVLLISTKRKKPRKQKRRGKDRGKTRRDKMIESWKGYNEMGMKMYALRNACTQSGVETMLINSLMIVESHVAVTEDLCTSFWIVCTFYLFYCTFTNSCVSARAGVCVEEQQEIAGNERPRGARTSVFDNIVRFAAVDGFFSLSALTYSCESICLSDVDVKKSNVRCLPE